MAKNDDLFDDMMDLHMLDEMSKNSKSAGGSNNNQECCGGICILMPITLPLWAPVALILNAAEIIKDISELCRN